MTKRIDVRVPTSADPATVYALLRGGASWPRWSPIDSFELASPGPDGTESVGAVRVFKTGPVTSREEIAELVPDRRLSYTVLSESTLPLRGYRADVDLEPDGDRTVIHWHSTFASKIPGTGWYLRWFLSRFITRCARGLAAEAERGGTEGRTRGDADSGTG